MCARIHACAAAAPGPVAPPPPGMLADALAAAAFIAAAAAAATDRSITERVCLYSAPAHAPTPGAVPAEVPTTPQPAKPGSQPRRGATAPAITFWTGTTTSPGIAMMGTLSLPGIPPVTSRPVALLR